MTSPFPALVGSERAPGLHIERDVVIPDDTVIAPHVTIYSGVEIGAGVVIGQGAMLGRPKPRDARSRSPLGPVGAPTQIGDGCQVGSGVVVTAGATMLAGAWIADNAIALGGAVLGEDAVLGRNSGIADYVRIGARTRIQNDVMIAAWAQVGPDVLIAPRVALVGDPTMGRRIRSEEPSRVVIGRACRIGTGAIILPPVEIGEEALVAAASLVTKDVPPRTVVAGSPARAVRTVRDDELLEVWE